MAEVSTARSIAPLRSASNGPQYRTSRVTNRGQANTSTPHLPGSGDTSVGSGGGGAPVGVRAAAPFETRAGATWPDAAPLLRRIFYSHQKGQNPHLLPGPSASTLQDHHRPAASIRSAQIQGKSLSPRRAPAGARRACLVPHSPISRLAAAPIPSDCPCLDFGVYPPRLGFQRRRVSCCKWRRQARGSNCIICKKIVVGPYR